MHISAVVCEIWIENKRVQNLQFRGDCDHPSPEKVVFTIDAKIGNTIIVLPLDNPLYTLEKTNCTPMCLAFALLGQQCVSSQGVLEAKLCPCNSKVIRKVSNHRFLDYGFWDIDGPKNGSLDVKYSLRKRVLLRCKSTQLAVQLHHEGKLCSTCLVVN